MNRSVLMVAQPTVAGVAQCVLDWSRGLQSAGWDVTVACPADGWLHTAVTDGGVAWHAWDSQRSPTAKVRTESRALASILDVVKPRVVFLHGSKAGLVGRLTLRGRLPTVFAPHAWSFEAVTGATAAAALTWERLAARWTLRYVCVSRAERDTGLRRKIHGRYVVARNGVDLRVVQAPDAEHRADLRAALGLAEDECALVCVGRICEQKGQDVMLAAWPRVTADRRTLTFVGGGPDLQTLAAEVTDPRVKFLGDADRATCLRLMAAADLVVLPSRWEGMALVPLESLAVGTPVVATDVNGAREAITSTVGALCPPDDPRELAAAVNRWLAQPRARLERARADCRGRVEADFEIQTTIDIIDAGLTELVQ